MPRSDAGKSRPPKSRSRLNAGWGGHERPVKLEWAVAGLVIWLISLNTCILCETEPEFVDLGYAQHASARGTTERPQE